MTYCSDSLNDRLPTSYVARIEVLMQLVRTRPSFTHSIPPDITMSNEPGSTPHVNDARLGAGVATIRPVTIPLETSRLEEVRELWIEILRLPSLSLVTVIKLLSPTSKSWSGRGDHLERRLALLDQPVHLVELDFLLEGPRIPTRRPLPAADAYAVVDRAERRPDAEIYAWSLHDRLPRIPIPLDAPDPDVTLDLAAAYTEAYDRGRYARILRYDEPLPEFIAPETRAWAEERARAGFLD